MRLAIRHTTRYEFSRPVAHGLQRLRLTPKETQGQKIVDWQMEYDGASEELIYEDHHVNTVALVLVDEGVTEVTVTCHGTVDTEDKAGVIGWHSGSLPLWAFLSQTKRTKPGKQMLSMIADVRSEDIEPIERLHKLSQHIRDRVDYRVHTSNVDTTAEEAVRDGVGVCQDHTHIFCGAARSLGIPARYVSGYLMMDDRIDQEATHAWAEAHVDGIGWLGFDISNGISPDARYVRVATGRDYTDAAPVTGMSYGAGEQALYVDLAVEQQHIEQ